MMIREIEDMDDNAIRTKICMADQYWYHVMKSDMCDHEKSTYVVDRHQLREELDYRNWLDEKIEDRCVQRQGCRSLRSENYGVR